MGVVRWFGESKLRGIAMRKSCIIFILLLTAGLLGTSYAAQLVVIASTAPALKVGAVIDGAQPIKLEQDSAVTLISSRGKVVKLKGPYTGRPDPAPAVQSGDLLKSLSSIVSGPPRNDPSLAVFRSAPGASRRDVWSIDVGRSGTYCVSADVPMKLWRAKASNKSQLTLKQSGTGQHAIKKEWPLGQQTLAWPEELPLEDKTAYLVRLGRSTTWERFEIAVLPNDLPTDAHRAAWMWENNCPRQARRLLDDIAKNAR